MDVNDAELLALAGDDSSDEGNTPAPSTAIKAASPLPPPSNLQNHITDVPSVRNSTPKASAKLAGANRTKKTTRKTDSEEEGEA